MFNFQFLIDNINNNTNFDKLPDCQLPNDITVNFSLQFLKSKHLVYLSFWDISYYSSAKIYLSMEKMWAFMYHSLRAYCPKIYTVHGEKSKSSNRIYTRILSFLLSLTPLLMLQGLKIQKKVILIYKNIGKTVTYVFRRLEMCVSKHFLI